LSTALTTLEIIEADFTVMASVGQPEKGFVNEYRLLDPPAVNPLEIERWACFLLNPCGRKELG
jgi:hypothetical protein